MSAQFNKERNFCTFAATLFEKSCQRNLANEVRKYIREDLPHLGHILVNRITVFRGGPIHERIRVLEDVVAVILGQSELAPLPRHDPTTDIRS